MTSNLSARLLVQLVALVVLAGCGGSGGSSVPATRAYAPKITVSWPARARAQISPSALADGVSIRFEKLPEDAPENRRFLRVERPAGAGPSTKTHRATFLLEPGTPYGMTFVCYNFAAFPSNFGRATVFVTVDEDGTLRDTQGRPVETVGLDGRFVSVSVQDGQQHPAGTTQELYVSAWSDEYGRMELPYGVLKVEVIAGGAHLKALPDGRVRCLSEGDATVIATIDGMTSEPAVVHVVAGP